MTAAGDPPLPWFILTDLAPGVTLVVPAGLQIGDALSIPEAVFGRWITIGAGDDQDIALRDAPRAIGRSHCRMTYRDGTYRIQGRLHPAGHAVNGERFFDCTARVLKDGDLITIGQNVTLRFHLPDADA